MSFSITLITLCVLFCSLKADRMISWNSKLDQRLGDVSRMKSLVPINQTETNSLAKFTMQETEKSTQVRSSCRVLGEKLNLSIYSIVTYICRTQWSLRNIKYEDNATCFLIERNMQNIFTEPLCPMNKNITSSFMFLVHLFQRVKQIFYINFFL